jgi:hypothetical protein
MAGVGPLRACRRVRCLAAYRGRATFIGQAKIDAVDSSLPSTACFAVMHNTDLNVREVTDKRLIWARLALDNRARLLRHLNPSCELLRWSKLA